MGFKVVVDDNYHSQDPDERYTLREEFGSYEEAEAVCKEIVDDFLIGSYKPGWSADKLIDQYRTFGEEPWVCSENSAGGFSGRTYAEQRALEIARRIFADSSISLSDSSIFPVYSSMSSADTPDDSSISPTGSSMMNEPAISPDVSSVNDPQPPEKHVSIRELCLDIKNYALEQSSKLLKLAKNRDEKVYPYPVADILMQALTMRAGAKTGQWQRLEKFLFEEKGDLFIWGGADEAVLPAAVLCTLYERLACHKKPLGNLKRLKKIMERLDWEHYRDRKGFIFFFALMEALIRHEPAFAEVEETILCGGRQKRNKSHFYPSSLFDESPFGVVNNMPFLIEFLSRQADLAGKNGDEKKALRLLDDAVLLCLNYDDQNIGLNDEQCVNFGHVTRSIMSMDNVFTRNRLFNDLITELLKKESQFWRIVPPLIRILDTAHQLRPLADMPNYKKLQSRLQEVIAGLTESVKEADAGQIGQDSLTLAWLHLYELSCLVNTQSVKAKLLAEAASGYEPGGDHFHKIAEILLRLSLKNGLLKDKTLASEMDRILSAGQDEDIFCKIADVLLLDKIARPGLNGAGPQAVDELMNRMEKATDEASYLYGRFIKLWSDCGRIDLPAAVWEKLWPIIAALDARGFRDAVLDAKLWMPDCPFHDQVTTALLSGIAESDPEEKAYYLETLIELQAGSDSPGMPPDIHLRIGEALQSLAAAKTQLGNNYAGECLLMAIARYAASGVHPEQAENYVTDGIKIALGDKASPLVPWFALSLAGSLFLAGRESLAVSLLKEVIGQMDSREAQEDVYNVLLELFRKPDNPELRAQIALALENAGEEYLQDFFRDDLREELAVFWMQAGDPARAQNLLDAYSRSLLNTWNDLFVSPYQRFGELKRLFPAPALVSGLKTIFEKFWEAPFDSFRNKSGQYARLAIWMSELGEKEPLERLYNRCTQKLSALGVDDTPYEINELYECLNTMGRFTDVRNHFWEMLKNSRRKENDEEYPVKIRLLVEYYVDALGESLLWQNSEWREILDYIKNMENPEDRARLYGRMAGAFRAIAGRDHEYRGQMAVFALELAKLLRDTEDGISDISRHLIDALAEDRDHQACVRAVHEMALMVFEGTDIGEHRVAMESLHKMGFASEARWRFDRLVKDVHKFEDDRDAAYGLAQIMGTADFLGLGGERPKLLGIALKRARRIENIQSRDDVLSNLLGMLKKGEFNKEKLQIISLLEGARQQIGHRQIYALELLELGRYRQAQERLLPLACWINFEPRSLVDYIVTPAERQWLTEQLLEMIKDGAAGG